jgi:hypothetical protein
MGGYRALVYGKRCKALRMSSSALSSSVESQKEIRFWFWLFDVLSLFSSTAKKLWHYNPTTHIYYALNKLMIPNT